MHTNTVRSQDATNIKSPSPILLHYEPQHQTFFHLTPKMQSQTKQEYSVTPHPLLPSIAIGTAASRFHHRGPAGFPNPDFGIVASRCEDAGVLGMPCNAIDTAGMCVERFDKEPVRPPNIDS